MNTAITLILNGLSYAAILFIACSGFSLIFGLMNVVSFCHGTFYLLSCFISYYAFKATGSWLIALIVGAAGIGLFAGIFKFTLFDRVMGDSDRESLMTLGMNFVVVDVITILYTTDAKIIPTPQLLQGTFKLPFGVKYPIMRFAYIGIAILIGLVIYLLLQRTKLGQIIRAGVDDKAMTSALGINISTIFTIVYVIGMALVGISGALGATYMSFRVDLTENQMLLYSMIIVTIGSMESIVGAAIGAIIVGLLDSFTKFYVQSLSTTLLFVLVVVILIIAPRGIMGRKSRRAA